MTLKDRIQTLHAFEDPNIADQLAKEIGSQEVGDDYQLATLTAVAYCKNPFPLEPKKEREILSARILAYAAPTLDMQSLTELEELIADSTQEELCIENSRPEDEFRAVWDPIIADEHLRMTYRQRWIKVGLHANDLAEKGAKVYSHSKRAYRAATRMPTTYIERVMAIEDDQTFFNVVRDIMRQVKAAHVYEVSDDMISRAIGEC